jgi:hypothetical protein
MSAVSTLTLIPASRRKRLTSALIATSLCTLLGACGNDSNDDAAGTSTLSSIASPAENSNGNTSARAILPADPASTSPAPAALTIQTPPLPTSDAGATLSAAAPTPLAPPVIHTVD